MTVEGRRVDEGVDGDRPRAQILVADEGFAVPHGVPPHTKFAMTVSPKSDAPLPAAFVALLSNFAYWNESLLIICTGAAEVPDHTRLATTFPNMGIAARR
jgi:hypothetical protein